MVTRAPKGERTILCTLSVDMEINLSAYESVNKEIKDDTSAKKTLLKCEERRGLLFLT